MQKVHEAHPEVYHYTTSVGLKGIIESNSLWATHISFLNDAEEQAGFFKRRLRNLLLPTLSETVDELYKTKEGRTAIDSVRGKAPAVAGLLESLHTEIRKTTLGFDSPFVSSFCAGTAQRKDDGLLSQWRGYGTDGGYAIVFDTERLGSIFDEESHRFEYQLTYFGDVDYADHAPHPELKTWEDEISSSVRKFILTNDSKAFVPMFDPITLLSCRFKHSGFAEESEVRFVGIPANDTLYSAAKVKGRRPRKAIEFRCMGGVLVPYISLLGEGRLQSERKLPIKKVIVGPHPDGERRRKSVEMLLRANSVEAEVVTSDIPYLGR